jgi:hypothetical protein
VADPPCSFVIGGSVSCGYVAASDHGPTSLPYTTEEEDGDVRNKQRQLIRQLQEALSEKRSKQKQLNGVGRNHRSSGDLVPQRQELSWRKKVRDVICRKFQMSSMSVRMFQL